MAIGVSHEQGMPLREVVQWPWVSGPCIHHSKYVPRSEVPINKLTDVLSGFQSSLQANDWAYSLQAIPSGIQSLALRSMSGHSCSPRHKRL